MKKTLNVCNCLKSGVRVGDIVRLIVSTKLQDFQQRRTSELLLSEDELLIMVFITGVLENKRKVLHLTVQTEEKW
jgi:hypothetical protein